MFEFIVFISLATNTSCFCNVWIYSFYFFWPRTLHAFIIIVNFMHTWTLSRSPCNIW